VKRQYLILLFITLLVLLMPSFVGRGALLNVLVFAGIYTMLAVALNLLLGFAGQISLGHAAFFGLGAYLSGVLTASYAQNPWLVMLCAPPLVAGIAFLLGYPVLKLKGHFLAMATLGFGIIFHILFNETVDVTGGPSGLPGIPNLSVAGFTFDSDLKNYLLVWGVTLLLLFLSINLFHSRIGRALRAIHDSEVAARVMGINARLLKAQIFALSAGISCLAGSLYAHTVTFISPTSFGFHFSVELVTMVIIGGVGTIFGPLLGGVLLTLLPEFLRVLEDYDMIVYGTLLIVMTMFLPGGLIRGIESLGIMVLQIFRGRGGDRAQG
jgi:branched-chain amino acid transport system permease protein